MIWCVFFVCVDFVCGTCTKMLVQFINSISLSHCKASQGTAEPPRPPAPAVHPHGTQRVGVRTRPSTLPSSTPEEQTNTSDLPHMSNPTITNRCMQREKSCLLGKKKQQNTPNKTKKTKPSWFHVSGGGGTGAGATATKQHGPTTQNSSTSAQSVHSTSQRQALSSSAVKAQGIAPHPPAGCHPRSLPQQGALGGDGPHCLPRRAPRSPGCP